MTEDSLAQSADSRLVSSPEADMAPEAEHGDPGRGISLELPMLTCLLAIVEPHLLP
jgi:hypothetical protein